MVAMNQLTTGGQNLATVNRRRKKPHGVPNPKRMFEEAQMVRRVKAYLKNMKVITDEEKLHAMSLECEPPVGGGTLASTAVAAMQLPQPSLRKRNPSPTPSAVSSTSSALSNGDKGKSPLQPKFGAASPQAVKKLLALSEPMSGSTKARPKSSPPPVHRNKLGAGLVGATKTLAVDLTAESSSVTSLPTTRKGNNHNSGSVTSNDSGLGFFNDHHHTYYTTTGSGSLSSHPPAQSQGASGQHSQLQQPSASLQNAELALRPSKAMHCGSSNSTRNHSSSSSSSTTLAQRPPAALPTSASTTSAHSSSRHRLKVGSPRSNRVNVHHAVPLDILHRTSNRNSADHSILINNRLILSATNTASTTKSPSSTTSNSSSKQAQAIRKTVFYNTDEDDETQVSAV